MIGRKRKLLRILFIIDHFGSGGAQRQMVTLANNLTKRGHQITFFTYHPTINHFTSIIDDNIRIINYHKKNRYSVSIIFALYKYLQNNNYDAILSFLSTPNIYSELMSLARVKIPVIASVRDSYSYNGIPLSRKIKEQFHRFADYITVNTHYQRILMEKRYAWIRNKIITIYNGVDPVFFNIPISKNNKKNMNTPDILGVGTVRKLKNIPGIIEGLKIYRNNYGECPLIRWAGKIPFEGEGYQEYIKSDTLLRKYSLTSQWEWLGEREDIPELLNNHNGLIIGSFHEGLPNALCEAFASGVPVLASRVCENPRLIKEGENGFLFNPSDPNTIAKSIRLFVQMPYEKRLIMSKNARIFAEREFSINKFTHSYESLFEKFIS